MQFSSDNFPGLGSVVWFIEKDVNSDRPIIKSGLIFAQLLRYGLGPLILVDTETSEPENMVCSDEDLNRYSPELLFDSAEAAGASI